MRHAKRSKAGYWAVGLLAVVLVAASLPPGGTFLDDDGNIHEGFIEAIAADGITLGCNPPTNDRYCPGDAVTREQMAALLVRALGLTDRGTTSFIDDDDSVFEADIERLGAAGITKGCNPPTNDRFCPTDVVTREQMAAFLTRAFGFTETGATGFVDDDGSVFEMDIEKLATAGITKGCNPPINDRFCPHDAVQRDQMASLLGRALGLAPIVPQPFGGEVVVGTDQEPPTLNPFAAGGDNSIVLLIGQSYFAGAYKINGETLELEPDLLVQLPTVANGGVAVNKDDGTMTVVFEILPEAVWSDGVPVSGRDFQFTLDVITDPETPFNKTTYEDVVSTIVEPKRFEFTMTNPTPNYELLFSIVIPEHAVSTSDFTTDWNDTMWPSAGPFVFDSWLKGDRLRVVRNDRYWRTDPTSGRALPFLDSVVFEFDGDIEQIHSGFEARQFDVIEPVPNLETLNRLEVLESQGAVLEVRPGPVWEHLNFQFGPGRLARNPNSANHLLDYRRAVAHAVDRQAIADDIWGGWIDTLDSYVDVHTATFSLGAWSQYDYDVARASAYVASAETQLGVDQLQTVFSTTSNNDARVRLAEMLVGMFASVGIEYENQLEDSLVFFGEILDVGLWDMGEWAWVGSPGYSGLVRTLELFDPESPPPDGANYFRWGTPDSSVLNAATLRFAAINDAVQGEVDQRISLPLLQEAEQILADEVVMIPLYARPIVLATWADQVGGIAINPSEAGFTWNIAQWYRVDL